MRRFVLLLTCAPLFAQPQAQAPLAGVIGIHVHCDPDSIPRSIDAIDLARLAKNRGTRGLVFKSHYEPTASMAYLVRDSKENRPFVSVSKNGELLPEVKQVIALVAQHQLTLETGHSSPVLITHAEIDQMSKINPARALGLTDPTMRKP